jgi:hypothetical protein
MLFLLQLLLLQLLSSPCTEYNVYDLEYRTKCAIGRRVHFLLIFNHHIERTVILSVNCKVVDHLIRSLVARDVFKYVITNPPSLLVKKPLGASR